MDATLCACPKLCRDYAERAWCALWPCFRGSRARVADRRRAISDAVKPRDIAPFPYTTHTTSCTLRVTPSLTLYVHIVPIRHRYPVKPLSARQAPLCPSSPSLPVKPLSARPFTVRCGLLWGIVMHPHLHSLCSVGLKTFCHYASYG